jgi:hypothetical protein
MRFVVSCLALSLAACSAESSTSEPVIPPLPDGGTADSGSRADGGSVQDASVSQDASTIDAGTGDAGTGDAGTGDAGTADASVMDGGVDAGVDATLPVDAGTDAGSPTNGGAADAGTTADASVRDASVDSGAAPDSGATVDAGRASAAADAAAPYAHTITIDGVNDFTAAETFATTTAGFAFYLAWDATYIYLGASGSDVQTTASASKWWTVYLAGNGATGSSTGVTYNTQTPALSFPAAWHLRWKTTNDYTSAKGYVGGAWTDANLAFVGDVYRGSGNDFVELRIARSVLGSPNTLRIVSAFLNEAGGSESTFAGAPSTTFTDGYNRAYTKAYQFDLGASPASATVVP